MKGRLKITRKSLLFAILMLPGVSFAANTFADCHGCTNININVYHSQFNSAADAVRDKPGGAAMVYQELKRMGHWNSLVSAVRKAQNANSDPFSLFTSLVQKMLGMTDQFTIGMDKISFIITANVLDGASVRYGIDLNKRIDYALYKSLMFIEARDSQGKIIPDSSSLLYSLFSNEYKDSDVNINSLSRLFESFGAVDIEDYCSQQMKIKCYVTSSRSDGAGHVSYTFRCPRGTHDAC